MRLRGSDSLLLLLFFALALGSIGLKAAAGPPPDGMSDPHPRLVERQLQSSLRRQGFATASRERSNRSEIVFARRGDCLLGVRDARGGASFAAVFAADMRRIGTVRYLYRGRAFETPPTLAFRLGRLHTEILSRIGAGGSVDVPVALATTPACGSSDFGLGSIRIPT